jgi:O-antigen ligase
MTQLAKTLPILAVLIFLTFPVTMAPVNVLLLLFLVGWIFSGQYRERWLDIRANPAALMALAMYAVILLGVTYTTAPAKDISLHLTKYYKLLLVPLLFSVLGDRAWQQRCMQAFAAAMLFILISTWLNVWFVLPWSKTQQPGWGTSHHVIGDYITQNVMMSFFVLLSLVYSKAAKTAARRYIWAAVALLAAISITHLSQGRTGYLLVAVILVVFIFANLQGKALWIALFGGILFLGASLASSKILTQRFELAVTEAKQSDVNNQSSIGHRLYNYKKTVELISEKPILGWGTGAYHTQTCRVVEKPEWCEVFSWHPHNQFLFFGTDHGMLGILTYLSLIASMVWLALRDTNWQSRTLLLGFASLLVADSLFNSPLWSSRENHFFTIMMALLIAQSGLALRSAAKPQGV